MIKLLEQAAVARADLLDERHEAALRLFNGFLEGGQSLVVELYGKTAVLHNYANPPDAGLEDVETAVSWLTTHYPWLQAIIVKTRRGETDAAKRGELVWGTGANREIREHGVRYAVDLTLNRDSSFYLDTRNLRRWLVEQMAGKTVLNTFAYTGSLGVAAMAGGASRVVQVDLNRTFLNLAKTSYTLNGFAIHKRDFLARDFWPQVSQLKRAGEQFDCVLLDPPFFSTTDKGTVDLAQNVVRLINKVRPLVRDGGQIVAINNALFYSGADYMAALQTLCADGYVTIERLIPVPPDCTGYPETVRETAVTDPHPFNHSTKIAVLSVRHKR
ncbi:MAG: class I SAM-dependent methyltransferase [Anaerolineales bacterium]|nr:class I SAM-dependent methyltransferase [Anaerolineales bacterium]